MDDSCRDKRRNSPQMNEVINEGNIDKVPEETEKVWWEALRLIFDKFQARQKVSNYMQLVENHVTHYIKGNKCPSFHRGGPGSNPGLVMWDFLMDKSGSGAGFLRELRFPRLIYIPSASPQSSSLSPEAGTIGQEWPQCQ
jgi:hypothetical protein